MQSGFLIKLTFYAGAFLIKLTFYAGAFLPRLAVHTIFKINLAIEIAPTLQQGRSYSLNWKKGEMSKLHVKLN